MSVSIVCQTDRFQLILNEKDFHVWAQSEYAVFRKMNNQNRISEEADKILKRELNEKWNEATYEKLRSVGSYGYTNTYLFKSANYEEFSSSAKIEVMLELAKLDLQKGTTIYELIFSCCQFFPKKEAI